MNTQQQKYMLFLDLDGVLVDFDAGVKKICGQLPQELNPRSLWPRLAKTIDFYENLDWMPDGKVLWEFVKDYSPIILTGLPMGSWAEPQKRAWCKRELGPEVEVITCMSRHKALRAQDRLERSNHVAGATPVLIDDRIKLKKAWDEIGGIFIHHQNTPQSIAELKKLKFQ